MAISIFLKSAFLNMSLTEDHETSYSILQPKQPRRIHTLIHTAIEDKRIPILIDRSSFK